MWKKTAKESESEAFIDTNIDLQEPIGGPNLSWSDSPAVKVNPGFNDKGSGSRSETSAIAAIGASIMIKGELTGEEDLVIQGCVEGTIHFKQHHVTVGKNGRIKAEVHAKGISIEGEVEGNLFAEEFVRIQKEGHVKGDIFSPKVALEEGCRFKGGIKMESVPANTVTQRKVVADRVTSKMPTFSDDAVTE